MQLNDKQLFEDCAESLTAMNETVEAARLFELAENWDQACQLYIQMQAWQKVHAILPNVSNVSLQKWPNSYRICFDSNQNRRKYQFSFIPAKNACSLCEIMRS